MEKTSKKMTLSDYYHNLPVATYPKTELLRQIAETCNVTVSTARNWVFGANLPNNPEHRQILSEITGIPQEELFEQ